MFTIDYFCDKCSQHETNLTLPSFKCECGGSFIHSDRALLQPIVFDAYYDPTIGKHLSSYKQQEIEGRKHITPQHPNGLSLVNENKKFLKEMRNIRKHRLDYIRMQYAKDTRNEPDSRRTVGKRTYSFAV